MVHFLGREAATELGNGQRHSTAMGSKTRGWRGWLTEGESHLQSSSRGGQASSLLSYALHPKFVIPSALARVVVRVCVSISLLRFFISKGSDAPPVHKSDTQCVRFATKRQRRDAQSRALVFTGSCTPSSDQKRFTR